jgi:hypothetical protein
VGQVADVAGEALVQVVGPADGWVLERLARRLAAKLPYARFAAWEPAPGPATRLVYYVNYALYRRPSGRVDVGFFTHRDDAQGFLEVARRVDACVCMARTYADWLREQGVAHPVHVPMGFDARRYRPRLVLAVVGRLDHPRKGRALVERLRRLPFVEVLATEGRVPEDGLPEVYQRADYVLVPATVEGGPLCLLEGLGAGRPVIAPEGVGLVPELGPSEHVRLYPAGDAEALARLVTACFEEKLGRSRLVEGRSWDRWAEDHHRLFGRLLRERGLALPEPAPGFRFGLLGGLELPWWADAGPLEEAADRAAAHLYWGEPRQARAALEAVLPRHPWAEQLLRALPARTAARTEGS